MYRLKHLVLCGLLIIMIGGCRSSETGSRADNLYVSGWYATYDATRGMNSFTNHIGLFNEINPVWYNLNPNYFTPGQPPIQDNSGGNKSSMITLARNNGVKILPSIQNFGHSGFDAAVIHQIVNDRQKRSKHITELVNLVVAGSFDGIDIDYENMAAADRTAFSVFIDELGQALAQRGKLLSVSVYAKTDNSANWTGPGAQDWSSLAKYADTLKVMAYDYHWSSFHAGPIAPVDWLTAILNYARTVPGIAGKLVIGLPSYGLDWPLGGTASERMYTDAMNMVNQLSISSLSRSHVYHSTNAVCGSYGKNVELHFTYTKNGVSHTVYFQDAVALRERLAIIAQYRDIVKGITFWHLGGEDPASWNEIKKYK